MKRRVDNEAVHYYRLARAMLDGRGVDRLHIEPRSRLDPKLTLKLTSNVLLIIWQPFGTSETALCCVEGGEAEPVVVTYHPGD